MDNREVLAVSRAADQAGMTYGRYVAKYGGKPLYTEEQKPKSKNRRVQRLSQDGELLQTFPNARAAAIFCGVRENTIQCRCSGRYKSNVARDGFVYQWEPQEEERSEE